MMKIGYLQNYKCSLYYKSMCLVRVGTLAHGEYASQDLYRISKNKNITGKIPTKNLLRPLFACGARPVFFFFAFGVRKQFGYRMVNSHNRKIVHTDNFVRFTQSNLFFFLKLNPIRQEMKSNLKTDLQYTIWFRKYGENGLSKKKLFLTIKEPLNSSRSIYLEM